MTRSSQSFPSGVARPLFYAAGATLLITILSLGQAVLVPFALAALIGCVLIAPVAWLERRGLHRMASVALVLCVVLGGVAGFAYELSRQLTDLATHMPQYSASITSKLATLRETRNGSLSRIQNTVKQAGHDLDKQEMAAGSPVIERPVTAHQDVQPVLVVPNPPGDLERVQATWKPLAKPIGTAGIVLILVIFMLAQREDLRNRIIRLAGRGRLTVTTRTLDEATRQISRFLFSQTLINAAFGVVIAVGLLVIGIPYALLWGVTAAILRFVPYLGTMIAMLLAAGLAFVGSEGWGPTIETLVLFWGAGITAYVLDPIVNGTRTGTSSFALLISAIFWTWLWGPVGLLLSTPIAVCLVAIGKHVPEMEFLTVLLSDQAPLHAADRFYQRLLAGDADEAAEIIDQQLGTATRAIVFDSVVVPTLLLADRDRLRETISSAEQKGVIHTTGEILRHRDTASRQNQQRGSDRVRRLLGVPVRSASDELAVEMMSQVLGATWTLAQLPPVTLASEVFDAIEETLPDMLCIAALAPSSLSELATPSDQSCPEDPQREERTIEEAPTAGPRELDHARYLCRQIHTRFPDVPICVLSLGAHFDPLSITRQLLSDGAQHVATNFTDAVAQIEQSRLGVAEAASNARSGITLGFGSAGIAAVARNECT